MQTSTPGPGRLTGKFALVTGAGSGIGQATALLLAEQGAGVHCADRDRTGADWTAGRITRAGGTAWPHTLDVSNEADWLRVMDQVVGTSGRLDVAVHVAGISFGAPVAETNLEDWRRVMAVNLDGVFLGTKHAIRVMRQHSGGVGSIVNVSSVSGSKAQPTASAYCASKAAVTMLSKCAALECLQRNEQIRVNVISPSGVKTPMWQTMPFFRDLMAKEGGEEQAFAALAKMSPHGRFATAEEVARAILYLATEESGYVTGTNLAFEQGDTA